MTGQRRLVDCETCKKILGGTRIVAAAVRLVDGTVITRSRPVRHPKLVHWTYHAGLENAEGRDAEGFLTDEGVFVDRVEAKIIAANAGQLNERGTARTYTNELYSEDVW